MMRFSSNCLLSLFLYAATSCLVHRVEAGDKCSDAPDCSSTGIDGKVVYKEKAGSCEETCATLTPQKWLLLGWECGKCPTAKPTASPTFACPATEDTRQFGGLDVFPDFHSGSGIDNGAFTLVTTSGTPALEIGLRAKTRFPNPLNPVNELPGQGLIGNGVYAFPAGVHSNGNQLWAFEWSVNTDLVDTADIPTVVPEDYTYELGMDQDPSPATNFGRFDPITPTAMVPRYDHSFFFNSDLSDTDDEICGGIVGNIMNPPNPSRYVQCLRTKNVVQQSWQYAFFLPLLPNFNPNANGNYVIYFRVLAVDPVCGKKYVVAENYIEVLVGTGQPLTSPPVLPAPL